MPTTLRNTDILFNDGTTQSTAASTGAFTNISYTGTLTGGTGVVNLGSGQLFKDANGNVGIGTSAPFFPLAVRQPTLTATIAEFRTIDGTNNPGLEIRTGTAGTTIAQVYSSGAAANLLFETNGVERLRITSTGNVGIGTSLPISELNLSSPTNINGLSMISWKVSGVDNNAYNIFPLRGGGSLHLARGLKSSGTTSDVFLSSMGGSTNRASVAVTDAGIQMFTDVASAVAEGTAITPTERVRIDSGGSLLVGTTSALNSGRQVISFTGSSRNGLVVSESANFSGTVFAIFSLGTSTIGSIARVGASSAVVYNTTSDERLKSNISDANPVLDKLMEVKVRQFDWKEGDLHQEAGFIAQELSPILSGVVTEGKESDDLWQLDYSRLTPYLVKAIQEQQVIITALTARIAALESN